VLRTLEEKPWLPPYQGDRAVLEQLAARLAAEPRPAAPARPRRLDSLDRQAGPDTTRPLVLGPSNDEDEGVP
jgi:hypothetical protein